MRGKAKKEAPEVQGRVVFLYKYTVARRNLTQFEASFVDISPGAYINIKEERHGVYIHVYAYLHVPARFFFHCTARMSSMFTTESRTRPGCHSAVPLLCMKREAQLLLCVPWSFLICLLSGTDTCRCSNASLQFWERKAQFFNQGRYLFGMSRNYHFVISTKEHVVML